MVYSPYDWNQNIQQRSEYIDGRLRDGSPVVALSCAPGIVALTVRGTQRKIFEIYDRLIFAGIGHQADLESIRLRAIDFCHQEGFTRSEDDVTIQRVVGFAISPVLKRAFGDPFTSPVVAKSLFAEVNATPAQDAYFQVDHDGEFVHLDTFGVAAGTRRAEEEMEAFLEAGGTPPDERDLAAAVSLALRAWAVGKAAAALQESAEETDDDGETPHRELDVRGEESIDATLREQLQAGVVEACLLRRGGGERNFRLLGDEELAPAVKPYLTSADGGA